MNKERISIQIGASVEKALRKIARDATRYEEAVEILNEFGAQGDPKVYLRLGFGQCQVCSVDHRWERTFSTFGEALGFFLAVLTGQETSPE